MRERRSDRNTDWPISCNTGDGSGHGAGYNSGSSGQAGWGAGWGPGNHKSANTAHTWVHFNLEPHHRPNLFGIWGRE